MATKKGMKKGLKARWLLGLRSGQYKQGRGSLQRDGRFCCLGVLCEVSPAVNIRNNGDSYLSKEALEYIGFDDAVQQKLANFNDDEGYGFRRIATWIEKNL